MENVVVSMFAFLGAFIIAFFILVIILYAFMGVFLGKLNKIMYGKKTVMSWIPVLNTYLMGKLAFNKIVGIILVIIPFVIMLIPNADFSNTSTSNQNGTIVTQTASVSLNNILLFIYSLVCLVIFVITVIKYFKLKNNRIQKIETPEPENVLTPPTGVPAQITPQTVVTSSPTTIADSFNIPDSLTESTEKDKISANQISAKELNDFTSTQGTIQTPGLETISIESNVPSNVFLKTNDQKDKTISNNIQSEPVVSEKNNIQSPIQAQTNENNNQITAPNVQNIQDQNKIIIDNQMPTTQSSVVTPTEVSEPVIHSQENITQNSSSFKQASSEVSQVLPGEPFDIFSSKPIDIPNNKQN